MNPDTRMATSLVLSLLVSGQNLHLALTDRADIVTVGVRYVAGFVTCFMLVGIVGRLYNAYLTQLAEREARLEGPESSGAAPAPVMVDEHREGGTNLAPS